MRCSWRNNFRLLASSLPISETVVKAVPTYMYGDGCGLPEAVENPASLLRHIFVMGDIAFMQRHGKRPRLASYLHIDPSERNLGNLHVALCESNTFAYTRLGTMCVGGSTHFNDSASTVLNFENEYDFQPISTIVVPSVFKN